MLDPSLRLALYMEGAVLGPAGKMGLGILRYSPNPISCIIDSETAGQSSRTLTGVSKDRPIVASVDRARELGSDVFVLGIAPAGGLIPDTWWPVIDEAVQGGLSIVNGLHDLIGPRYPTLARFPSKASQFVWDIRIEPTGIGTATGAAASLENRRLLLIGTDMAVGKMTAGLEIWRVAKEQGVKAAFVATGQIGISVTGAGIPLDAIRVDFAAGAVEQQVLLRSMEGAELVIVEGQGSLGHPGSSANLPLLRGSCPTHLILCHRAGQRHLTHLQHVNIPPLGGLCRLYEDVASACGIFPRPATVGVALNTAHLGGDEADRACRSLESELQLPCVDPIRHGAERLVEAVLR